ncbi:Hypothetical predicted protein [Mytilus galloprovincialis]|uniref:HYR domain-containing protein n=1 Tax=Mytilus galloprovincialis TaxID=29158 RepID=A0A8B6BHC5_MYTGA|nr:Hypothetical predicted protein [Mytilus galloprovincialis]
MGRQLLIVIGFLIQLSVTCAEEECPYKGLKTLNADKGKRYAEVNPDIPGAYNFKPKLPVKVYEYTGWNDIDYSIGNDTKCVFTVVVKVLRCEQEVSNISDYEGGTNCSNLIWGKSCNAACSDGKVSVGGPAVYTCELDNSNRTFLQLDKATVCQNSAFALKCPQDMTIFTPTSTSDHRLYKYEYNWTIPSSLDSHGKPWTIESQTATNYPYEIGKYTNVVTAYSSTGEISSCKFDFIIKRLECTLPQVDDSTIKGASPNSTYYIKKFPEKKICKQGYDFQKIPYDFDFVFVECEEISPGHAEFTNWDSRNCTKNEIPKICGKEVQLDGKQTKAVSFTYDFMEWKTLVEQNITSCKFGAFVDVHNPTMYDLEMTFQTDTSIPFTSDECFFEVLLYAGKSSLGTPMKKFDCNLKGSVKMKWPTLDFTLVFRVLDSFKSQQNTDLTGNGTILFSMTECSSCALSNLTGLDLIESEIPSFKFSPFLPCRMDGCLEDSLHMFKIKRGPNTWDQMVELEYKTCTANIKVQSNTKKICFHQANLEKRDWVPCRRAKKEYLPIFIHLDSFFTLVIQCDDLQGWWCLPQDLPKFENLTITWELGYFLHGSVTEELWVLSVSSVNNSQTCSQPVVYTSLLNTTMPPVIITQAHRDADSSLSTPTILGIVAGVLAGICLCLVGAYCCCCKKRKSQGKPDTDPDDVRLSMLAEHNGKH